jgi:hypothetical protein
MFKSLEIHTWRQIEKVEISFHNRLTILTGAKIQVSTTRGAGCLRRVGFQVSAPRPTHSNSNKPEIEPWSQ